MSRAIKLAPLLAASLWCSSALAVPVTEWGYDVSTRWLDATFTTGTGIQRVNDSVVSWGGNGNLALGSIRSGLRIEDHDDDIMAGGLFTNGEHVETAVISHTNNIIGLSYATLQSARIETSLTLRAHEPDGPIFATDTLAFDIHFSETANNRECGFASTSLCDDIFVIDWKAFERSFTWLGYNYFVNIVHMGNPMQPLSDEACAIANTDPGCFGFTTPEGRVTGFNFGIMITSSPIGTPQSVSEPGLLALAGLGLLGLAWRRRTHA